MSPLLRLDKNLHHNTFVALPTGLDKTFIAATIMLNWSRWTSDSQIVFVAPESSPWVISSRALFHGYGGTENINANYTRTPMIARLLQYSDNQPATWVRGRDNDDSDIRSNVRRSARHLRSKRSGLLPASRQSETGRQHFHRPSLWPIQIKPHRTLGRTMTKRVFSMTPQTITER